MVRVRLQTRQGRTGVPQVKRGLWPMAAEPGPNFRWGALLRASKPRRVRLPDGSVQIVEESTDRQDLELPQHIRDYNMGVVVESYKDVASAWMPGAKRPRYKHALVDLAEGYIDGIACLAVDRLTRRRDQVRPILNAMEEMGGRLFFLWDELDTASDDPDTELRLHELVARAEREAERTSRRYKLVAQHRAQRGLHHGSGNRAYGHSKDYRSLVREEAERLQQAAKAADEGKSLWAIAEEWTEQGVPTVIGKNRWHHKSLWAMLTSARMVGKREYEGALIEIEYMPPILDEELWRRLRVKLAPDPSKRGRRESRELTNIALCAVCGLPLVAQMDRAGPVYLCKKRPSVPGACGGIVTAAHRRSYRQLSVHALLPQTEANFRPSPSCCNAHSL